MKSKYRFISGLVGIALGFSPVAIAQTQGDANPILQEEGILEDEDAVLDEDGSRYDIYTFDGRAAQVVTITLESSEFDTYLLLADSKGEILETSDDLSDENTNSTLSITLPRDDTYNVIVNGYESSDRGRYTLIVR